MGAPGFRSAEWVAVESRTGRVVLASIQARVAKLAAAGLVSAK